MFAPTRHRDVRAEPICTSELACLAELRRQLATTRGKLHLLRLCRGKQPGPGERIAASRHGCREVQGKRRSTIP
ncbi:MAG TPA: hypothetical protein VG057_10145 [Solirubrobacteraceae bacterium]|jgi:hypothetical protein|nr:hypothetical protein [Solirubrobacteraceae bacterium]